MKHRGFAQLYLLIGIGIVVLGLIAGAGALGYSKGHANGDAKRALADKGALDAAAALDARKSTKLRDAAVALRAAATSFRAVARAHRETVRRGKEALASEAGAKVVAKQAAASLRERVRALEGGLDAERVRSPSCAALLDFDIDAELAKAGCRLGDVP